MSKPSRLHCIADIRTVPMGTGSADISEYVAGIECMIRKSHLKSTMHAGGHIIEGPWSEVTDFIGSLHAYLQEHGCVRVGTNIRIETRSDIEDSAYQIVETIEKRIANGDHA